jgi:hypothetical protein
MVRCSIGNFKAEHDVTISLNGQISVSGTSIPQVLAFSRRLLNNTQND